MIKRFAFRLDQVLRHRANVRDLKEREFSVVEAQLIRERGILAELLRMRGEMLDSLATLQKSGFENLERELYAQYLGWLASEVDREKAAIAEIEVLLEEKRKELVRALQDHRIVERLRERRHEDYMKELERTDQAGLDETAAGAHARGVRILGAATAGGTA